MFCIDCGTALPDTARYCSACGAKTGAPTPTSAAKPRPDGTRRPIRGTVVVFMSGVVIGYMLYRLLIVRWVPTGLEWMDIALALPLWLLALVDARRCFRGDDRGLGFGLKPLPGTPNYFLLYLAGDLLLFALLHGFPLAAAFALVCFLASRPRAKRQRPPTTPPVASPGHSAFVPAPLRLTK